jgi:putative transposase
VIKLNNRKEENHMSKRKIYTPEFKAKIVIEILKELNTISEIGAREGISPNQLGNWKREFLSNAHRAFSTTKDEIAAKKVALAASDREQELMAKIGQLTYECDWLKKKYATFGTIEKGGHAR